MIDHRNTGLATLFKLLSQTKETLSTLFYQLEAVNLGDLLRL